MPLRRAYDELAWNICAAVIPSPAGCRRGCGLRRRTLGPSRPDCRPSRRRNRAGTPNGRGAATRLHGWTGTDFTLLTAPVEDVELEPGTVDAVLAIGSLQYTADPPRRCGGRPDGFRSGGMLCVLVDSLHALVIELLRADRPMEASDRLETRRGSWRIDGAEADLHLFDEAALRTAMVDAGLEVVQVAGLLVGASAHGRAELTRRLEDDYESALAIEQALAAVPAFADPGKQHHDRAALIPSSVATTDQKTRSASITLNSDDIGRASASRCSRSVTASSAAISAWARHGRRWSTGA